MYFNALAGCRSRNPNPCTVYGSAGAEILQAGLRTSTAQTFVGSLMPAYSRGFPRQCLFNDGGDVYARRLFLVFLFVLTLTPPKRGGKVVTCQRTDKYPPVSVLAPYRSDNELN